MKAIMSMGQCISVAVAIADMEKPEAYCKETGYKVDIIGETETLLTVLVIEIDDGEAEEYLIDKGDRKNHQYLFANKNELALLVVDKA